MYDLLQYEYILGLFLDSSQDSTDDMDLGTPPRAPRAPKVMNYDNSKEINGTQIERVLGIVSVEDKVKEKGLSSLSLPEKRNLAAERAEKLNKTMGGMSQFEKQIGKGGDTIHVYKPPHERSTAVAAAFTATQITVLSDDEQPMRTSLYDTAPRDSKPKDKKRFKSLATTSIAKNFSRPILKLRTFEIYLSIVIEFGTIHHKTNVRYMFIVTRL